MEGGEPVQLNNRFSYNPVVSPDGKLIACRFTDEQSNSPDRLAILSIDGGDFIKTFEPPITISPNPNHRWTTDGRTLVFIDMRNDVSNLWGQPVDGGPQKQLTEFKTDRIFRFDFSKDGRQLACSRGATTSDVVVISGFR